MAEIKMPHTDTWGMFIPVFGQEKTEQKGATQEAEFTIAKAVAATGVESNKPPGASETFPPSTEKV